MVHEYRKYLQKVSMEALKGLTKNDFEVKDTTYVDLTYYQYLASVVIGAKENKILLTVHFWEDDAVMLSQDPGKALARSVKRDMFKEYLNIFSSRIKNAASLAGMEPGISLPFIVPGYQSCFIMDPSIYRVSYCWELIRDNSHIGFGCSLIRDDPVLMKRMCEYQDIRGENNELEIL